MAKGTFCADFAAKFSLCMIYFYFIMEQSNCKQNFSVLHICHLVLFNVPEQYFDIPDMVQWDPFPICQQEYSHRHVDLPDYAAGRDVIPSLFLLVRFEVQDFDLRALCEMISQPDKAAVQGFQFVFIQLRPVGREALRFTDSDTVAGQSGEGRELGGPVLHGHLGVLL